MFRITISRFFPSNIKYRKADRAISFGGRKYVGVSGNVKGQVIFMSNIRVLCMDIDGTLTDGKIYMGEKGEIMKAFNVHDGYGIRNILPEYNIIPVVITNRKSDITAKRCKELDIDHVYQECKYKENKIKEIAQEYSLTIAEKGIIEGIAYIGDYVPDIPAMKLCECVGCPADAMDEVKAMSDYVCKKKGGEGAVREFIEWFIVHA